MSAAGPPRSSAELGRWLVPAAHHRGRRHLPARILSLSDVREELDAARATGWRIIWLVREGVPGLAAARRRLKRFDQIPL